ncbi:MAG TPA: hypothetical protein VHD36_00810 [Pirellulales bacterium]|nr:hypothetical protein [Pirellulales bacterium]
MAQRHSRPDDAAAVGESSASVMPSVAIRKVAWGTAILTLFGLTPSLFLHATGDIRNPDPFYYAQAARQVLAGQRLYTEVWPDKPPVLVWAYALPQLFVPRSYRGIAFFCGCCVAATAAMYVWAFRRAPAAAAACALFLALFPLSYWDWACPSSEIVANLFVAPVLIAALEIYRRGQSSLALCLTIGVCGCLAFHVRQNMVLSLFVPIFAIGQTPRPCAEKLRALATIAASGLACWAVILAAVFATGDVPMYFWTVFVYPRLYANLGAYQGNADWRWMLSSGPLPWIVAIFGILAATSRRQTAFAFVVLAVGWGAAMLPGRNYSHYWANTFPFVALVVGLGVERLAKKTSWKAWLLSAGLAVVLVQAMFSYFGNERFGSRDLENYESIAAVADEIAPPGGTLMVVGAMPCEAIQFASRLRPANTFQWMFHLLEPNHRILPTPLEEIEREYLDSPPDVLVSGGAQGGRFHVGMAPEEIPADVRLVQALLVRYNYRPVARLGDFEILRRFEK